MISSETATEMGIRFLRKEKCLGLADGLEYYKVCLDATFKYAVRTLGKRKVLQLYNRLPKQLKVYVLWELVPKGDKRFHKKFMDIWDAYPDLNNRDRPDRCREFPSYYRRAERALLKYLGD